MAQQGQKQPIFTSPRTMREYPFPWNKPTPPTDADFEAFEREIEAREAAEDTGGGAGPPPSSASRFIGNALEASPLNVPGMISGLIGLASNPSQIPSALKRSLIDPLVQHGGGALRELATTALPFDPKEVLTGKPNYGSEALEALPLVGPGFTQGREQAEGGDVAGGAGTTVGTATNLFAALNPRTATRALTAGPRAVTNWAGRSALGADTATVRNIFDEGLMYGSPAGGARKAADVAATTRAGVQKAVTPVGGQLPATPAPSLLSTARGYFNRAGDDLIGAPAPAAPVPNPRAPGAGGQVQANRLPHGEAVQAAYRRMDPADIPTSDQYVQSAVTDPRLATGAPARALDLEAAMLDKARLAPQDVVNPMRQGLASEIRTQVGRGYPAQQPALQRLGRLDQAQTVLERAARRAPSGGVSLGSDVKYGLIPWMLKRGQGALGQYGHTGLNLAEELLPPLTRAAILGQLAGVNR